MTEMAERTSRQDRSSTILVAAFFCALPAVFDLPPFLAALGVLGLALTPIIFRQSYGGQSIFAEPIVPISAVWFMAVTLPLLMPVLYVKDATWQRLSPWSVELAAIWMYRGFAAFCLSYWTVRTLRPPVERAAENTAPADLLFKRMVGTVGAIGVSMTLITSKGQLYTFLQNVGATTGSTQDQIFSVLGAFVYAYAYLVARGQNKLFEGAMDKYLFVGTLTLQTMFIIASGTKAAILALGVAWLIGRASREIGDRRLVNELGVVIGGAAFAWFASSVVTAYRFEIRLRYVPVGASFFEMVGFQFDGVLTAVSNLFAGKDYSYGSNDLLARFAHLASFARVLDYTGGLSPHENAITSFLAPVYAVLPRAWIAKPIFMGSGQFAQMIGWKFGGFSLSLPGSIYWAWGFFGIPLAMGGIGAALAFLSYMTDHARTLGLVFRVVLVLAVITLLDVGGELQALLTTSVRYFLLAVLLHYLASALASSRYGYGR